MDRGLVTMKRCPGLQRRVLYEIWCRVALVAGKMILTHALHVWFSSRCYFRNTRCFLESVVSSMVLMHSSVTCETDVFVSLLICRHTPRDNEAFDGTAIFSSCAELRIKLNTIECQLLYVYPLQDRPDKVSLLY